MNKRKKIETDKNIYICTQFSFSAFLHPVFCSILSIVSYVRFGIYSPRVDTLAPFLCKCSRHTIKTRQKYILVIT